MTGRHVVSGGAQLHVVSWGERGRPILALHPGVADSRVWQWCAPTWAEAGYRVIAYDRRGFGDSRHVAELHDDLDDLRAVAEATEVRSAVVIGNSRGGGLALDSALASPDDVSALVLIAPSPAGYDATDWPTSAAESAQDELLEAADAAGDIDLVNELEVRYWLDGVDQPAGRVEGSARELMLEMNGRALRSAPIGESTRRTDTWSRLPELAIPTLVVVGAHDLPGIRRQCGEIAAAMPSARLATIPGSAHCPSLDAPLELSAMVLDFLGDVLPEPT